MKVIYKDRFPRWVRTILRPIFGWRIDNTKVKVKLEENDVAVYSLDCTLAHIILPCLKQLREIDRGCHTVDDEDVPFDYRTGPSDLETDEEYAAARRKWEYVLDEMIWSFERIIKDDMLDVHSSGEMDIGWKECEDQSGFSEMVTGPNHTFKIDKEAMKATEDQIQNGLRLFAKYYRGLWW